MSFYAHLCDWCIRNAVICFASRFVYTEHHFRTYENSSSNFLLVVITYNLSKKSSKTGKFWWASMHFVRNYCHILDKMQLQDIMFSVISIYNFWKCDHYERRLLCEYIVSNWYNIFITHKTLTSKGKQYGFLGLNMFLSKMCFIFHMSWDQASCLPALHLLNKSVSYCSKVHDWIITTS